MKMMMFRCQKHIKHHIRKRYRKQCQYDIFNVVFYSSTWVITWSLLYLMVVNTGDCSNIYSEVLSTSLLARASTVFPLAKTETIPVSVKNNHIAESCSGHT